MDPKRAKRSKHDSVAPFCREESHRQMVAAMVQYVEVAALAGEMAKCVVPQVSEVLSVDEIVSQLVSRHRTHLTAMLAKALVAELVRPSEA